MCELAYIKCFHMFHVGMHGMAIYKTIISCQDNKSPD